MAIVRSLRPIINHAATSLSRVDAEVSLLREYRARLIADVVTGKLDVRDVAGLSGKIEELEALDDLDSEILSDHNTTEVIDETLESIEA